MTISFNTIRRASEGLYKERGSKFIAFAFPVSTEEEIKQHLQEIHKLHPKARHYCFAYRLGYSGDDFRSNDDGEPSGTAGKPILGQIDAFEVTNVLVIVVRYFGGKLLGASGLITAYRESARDALDRASILVVGITHSYLVKFHYAIMGPLMDILSHLEVDITSKELNESPSLKIELPVDKAEGLLDRILAVSLSLHLEQVANQRKFDLIEIEQIG